MPELGSLPNCAASLHREGEVELFLEARVSRVWCVRLQPRLPELLAGVDRDYYYVIVALSTWHYYSR
jgi:hypothetical protein